MLPRLPIALMAALLATAAACGDVRLHPYVLSTGGTGGTAGFTGTCPNNKVGFATVAGADVDGGVTPTTNGGNDSPFPPVTVRDETMLRQYLEAPDARVIFLDGMIAPAMTLKVTTDKNARNGNKTLIGVGSSSGLTGAGLDLSYADNVIVQNLKIAKVSYGEGDAITLLASHHIWIDHCDLSSDRDDTTSGYDGLVDITHGSSFVTVSWNWFHDHRDTSLVGHTADVTQMQEDAALSVTYHHNLFLNVNSGPRIRFGTVHLYSNHFQTVTAFGIASESFATVWVDHNLFEDVALPIVTSYQDPNPGTMLEMSNKFPAGFVPDIMRPSTAPPPLPYSYSADSAESSSAIVGACAGTGKINFQ